MIVTEPEAKMKTFEQLKALYYKLFGKEYNSGSEDNVIVFNDPHYISLQSDDHGQPILQENKLG